MDPATSREEPCLEPSDARRPPDDRAVEHIDGHALTFALDGGRGQGVEQERAAPAHARRDSRGRAGNTQAFRTFLTSSPNRLRSTEPEAPVAVADWLRTYDCW